MTWTIFAGSDNEWDDLLKNLKSTSPFNLSSWARTRRHSRWNVLRVTCVDNGEVSCAAQVFWFKFARLFTISWVPGGIVGDLTCSTPTILKAISSHTKSPAQYLRVAFHSEVLSSSSSELSLLGWTKARNFIGASETFTICRTTRGLADSATLSSNWSRNLQRGLKRNLSTEIWHQPDAGEIHRLMCEMVEFKKDHGPQSVTPLSALTELLSAMKDQMVVIHTRDEDGKLIAVRGAYVVGANAWDAVAAANEQARKLYASYVCAWKLVETLDSLGVECFDLAGIDPTQNEGVYNFKKGLGGSRIEYLGEWEMAKPKMVRGLVGLAVSRLK